MLVALVFSDSKYMWALDKTSNLNIGGKKSVLFTIVWQKKIIINHKLHP